MYRLLSKIFDDVRMTIRHLKITSRRIMKTFSFYMDLQAGWPKYSELVQEVISNIKSYHFDNVVRSKCRDSFNLSVLSMLEK